MSVSKRIDIKTLKPALRQKLNSSDAVTSGELANAVQSAVIDISSHVVKTPTVRLPWLDTADREVWAKLECWQNTGAFKYRGAMNAMLHLAERALVVASSAGNHGLGVATAAARLNLQAVIFVPVGASPLKIKRIEETGAVVRILGKDVHEATLHAVAFSKDKEAIFISPYAHLPVVAGNGTLMPEAVEQAGTFDVVLVPIGGGGLISGIGAWNHHFIPECRTVGIHPLVFGRPMRKSCISQSMFEPVVPSIADGLAAQWHEPSLMRNVLDETVDDTFQISEAGFATAIFALLHKQGLLVEGAGAAGVATLLSDQNTRIKGKTLIVITGGNIASSQLARAMASEVTDSDLRRKLGLRYALPALHEQATSNVAIDRTRPTERLQRGDFTVEAFWKSRVVDLSERHKELTSKHAEFKRLADYLQLDHDEIIDRTHEAIAELTGSIIESTLEIPKHIESWVLEERVRYVLQLQSFLQLALDRASAAYDQSKRVWFYDTKSQGGAGVNYARYGASELRTAECRLQEMLGFDESEVELLLTSSGMAAYQVFESFLVRHVLSLNDSIALSPYIYFEADEQLVSLSQFRHVRASSYKPLDIIQAVELSDAKVLFADPIANYPGLPVIDLHKLADEIGDRDWSHRWIVLDGSLLSGGIQPFSIFDQPNHPRVLYYESASKYVQFGLDLQMAGVCIYPADIDSTMRLIRRNSGTIMYPQGVTLMPRASRLQYLSWMKNLAANAELFAERLAERVKDYADVAFPREWNEMGWKHGGAIVTVEFHHRGLNNRDGLEHVIELCLRNARELNVGLIKGVSFGFSTTRISASSAMAENSDPFLRFSIGCDVREIDPLVECVFVAIVTYADSFSMGSQIDSAVNS